MEQKLLQFQIHGIYKLDEKIGVRERGSDVSLNELSPFSERHDTLIIKKAFRVWYIFLWYGFRLDIGQIWERAAPSLQAV